LDDLTTHAKFYREISLLSRRPPGRQSYPGDIFHLHARFAERAGNIKISKNKVASITLLPIGETLEGDMAGYIQTNLMAMTDGHIFFDSDFYNQGRRPAINPFLSVTRVGRQAQSALVKDLSREVSTFMVRYKKMQEFVHFGAELNEEVRRALAMGDRLVAFFDQPTGGGMDLNVSVILTAFLWAGFWEEEEIAQMKAQIRMCFDYYHTNPDYKVKVNEIISKANTFADLVTKVRENKNDFISYLFADGQKNPNQSN